MATQALTYRGPGTGGMVTDEPSWRLKANQSPYMRNVILTRQVAAERNGWDRTAAADIFGAGLGGQIDSVAAVQFDQTTDTVTLLVTKAAGGAWGRVAPSSSVVTDATLPKALVRAFYQGQAIICPTDGISSIRRSANSWAAGASIAGTVTMTTGSPIVTGAGTNFPTSAPVGSYYTYNASEFQFSSRVISVQSNTLMTLEAPLYVTGSDSAVTTPFGYVGLATLVADAGQASSASPTVTGSGTAWTSARRGYGAVRAGDMIAPSAGATASGRILFVNTDTSLTLNGGSPSWSAQQVNVFRSLVGREACVHNNTLYVTGVQWAPRRLYHLPPGKPLGQVFNDEDSYDVNRGAARLAKWDDVPGPDAGGHIEALLSSPGPLLVLATDGCYGDFGFEPDTQIELMADGAGCLDLRSACSGEPGQAWCGPEGIYLYRRGRIEDLTEGRRNREWRRLMNARDKTSAIICAGFYGGKLVVSVADGPSRTVRVQDYLAPESTSQTWTYDFGVEAWDGLQSGIRARYLATSQLPGQSDELYMVTDESAALTPVNQIAALGSAFRDEINGPVTNRDGLVMDLPANAEGGSLTEIGRMTKVRLALEVDQNTNTAITLSTTDTPDATSDTTRSIGVGQVTGAGEMIYERFRPVSDVGLTPITRGLGTRTRAQRLRLTRTGVQPNALRIHEVEVTSRPRPQRG